MLILPPEIVALRLIVRLGERDVMVPFQSLIDCLTPEEEEDLARIFQICAEAERCLQEIEGGSGEEGREIDNDPLASQEENEFREAAVIEAAEILIDTIVRLYLLVEDRLKGNLAKQPLPAETWNPFQAGYCSSCFLSDN